MQKKHSSVARWAAHCASTECHLFWP